METNNMTQWVTIGVAVLILLVGGAWLVSKEETGSPVTGDNLFAPSTSMATIKTDNNEISGETYTVMTVPSDGEKVTVVDQSAGTSVEIAELELTRASWIAVRDDMSILGAKWLSSSETAGTVKLQRATEAGKTYRVVIYVDDGDKKFDFKKDSLIMVDSMPLSAPFTAQ